MAPNIYRSESGQTASETILIIAAIALACVIALIYLGGGISRVFDSIVDPSGPTPGPFTPPAPAAVPRTIDDCLNGGWRDYPQFVDEPSCIDFVTGG